MNKPTAIYFYQYLPPWRIDVFNEIGKYYNLTIVFTNAEAEGFTYNRELLLSKLHNINTIFLSNGFSLGSHKIRFGIYKTLKKLRPSFVFTHEYPPTSILAATYKKHFGYKLIATTSDNVIMAENAQGLKAICRNYVLNRSDGIIVYSESVRQWYKAKFPDLAVSICPNIQNPHSLLSYKNEFPAIIEKYRNNYNILPNEKIILYTGRLVEVKGLDLLLNAFAKTDNTEYRLIIVGAGHLESNLKSLATELKIRNRVIFPGQFSGAQLYAWYSMANFFILPSRYEPFGAVVNEALVYGCPVVASKFIGALDFINESNGIIFNPLDGGEFVATLNIAMKKYLNPQSKEKNLMIRNFDEYVKAFLLY